MKILRTLLLSLIILATGGFVAYQYPPVHDYVNLNILHIKPCTQPITYYIENLDPKFGLSKTDLVSALGIASDVWNKALDKKIFVYTSTASDIGVNLIYDKRQQVTDTLDQIDSQLTASKANYNSLKAQYDTLSASYTQDKAKITADSAQYDEALATYNANVDAWNSSRKTSRQQYSDLQQERDNLDAMLTVLNQEKTAFNQSVQNLNNIGAELNAMAKDLNLTVNQYNAIGQTTGPEFDEGEYVENGGTKSIDVYQFDVRSKLIRVLTHEFGHALGLDHVSNASSIMYPINKSTNMTLTTQDLAELKRVCKL